MLPKVQQSTLANLKRDNLATQIICRLYVIQPRTILRICCQKMPTRFTSLGRTTTLQKIHIALSETFHLSSCPSRSQRWRRCNPIIRFRIQACRWVFHLFIQTSMKGRGEMVAWPLQRWRSAQSIRRQSLNAELIRSVQFHFPTFVDTMTGAICLSV
jgi:hypothetical protein